MNNQILLFCRAGFEKETAAEITAKANELGLFGYAKTTENQAYVLFEFYTSEGADTFACTVAVKQLIFARQLIVVSASLTDLPLADRISPIVKVYQQLAEQGLPLAKSQGLLVESADTNEAKSLLTFCKKFTVPLRQALRQAHLLAEKPQPTPPANALMLHVVFTANNACFVGYAYAGKQSPHFMGILRLQLPKLAPSRSTLKLEEAILTFMTEQEEKQRFNDSQVGVDLGACPGGWTYQLIKRGVFVYAVDHGKMATSLFDTGRIEHCSEDGFKFQPPKGKQVQWLVCDMVEKPSRITQLIAKWFTNGWTQQAIFNLKLPMKKRYAEVQQCLENLQTQLKDAGLRYQIQAKQLYHDREEITVYVRVY